MEAVASLIAGSLFIMSDQLMSARRHRHARTFPALNHVPERAVTVRGEPPARYCLAVPKGGSALGLDAFIAPPEPRGLGGHLGFPKIWVAKEMRSHRQPEQSRAEQGGLNDIVGFHFCCCPFPTAWCTAQCTAQLT